ncbi:hypothetical protein ALC60_11664, partial [Trachymyrmex zeteki]
WSVRRTKCRVGIQREKGGEGRARMPVEMGDAATSIWVSTAGHWCYCIIQKYAWRRKSDGKVSRRHIKENVEEEAWENKDGSGRGKAEEEKEEEEVEEKETLPLFDVAGETKNGGQTVRGEEENDG